MSEDQMDENVLKRLKSKYRINVDNEVEISAKTGPILVKGFPENKKQKLKHPNNVKPQSLETTIVIDPDVVSQDAVQITGVLEAAQIRHMIQPQIVPNTITWTHTDPSNNTEVTSQNEEINEAIIIIHWNEVLNLVETHSLTNHIQSLQEILPKKRIYLGIFGFDNYFKFWKLKKNNSQNEFAKTAQKKYANYMLSPKISRYELEFALTEVQILLGCCYRFLETSQDICDMIIQYTKSVMQAPQKLENRERYKHLEWYIPKDNRDCVQVDKNGNGLHRVWQQQLTMFESVRLETAEAIISVYPTPASLFEAYKNCSESEGRNLLENLPIRRAAGPLTTSRKIGPQLSSKMYNFFNAVVGDTVI